MNTRIIGWFFVAMGAVLLLVLAAGCAKKTETATVQAPLLPSVTTNTAVTVTGAHSALTGGTVTAEGTSAVTARGICYCLAPNLPTIAGSHTQDGTGAGDFSSSLDLLTGDTIYFIRAYATNSQGTTYGNRVSFYTSTVFHYFPGQNYGGGIVFYVDGTAQHGLIAATSEYSLSWGCPGLSIPGTGRSLGTGQPNTKTIIAACAEKQIAAGVCDGLILNGKSDWFLPSKDELNLMFLKRDFIGEFSNDYYWSSSQYDANQAYSQHFSTGEIIGSSKNGFLQVRAIRIF
ncbi:MAG: hypothetical protein WCO44_06940 [Bacteroidota bacterium]